MDDQGCIRRPGGKTAGATIYLVEELGDARLRCDQLTRYVTEAVQVIEKSPQKEAIFEVGGHLINAIPEALFKLQKSLQAVALATARIDYEEIKQELRPEKVEQLEKVLQDVRIRQINRRSLGNGETMAGSEKWKVAYDWTAHFGQDVMQLASPQEVREKFKKENPSLDDSALDEIVGQWMKNKDVVKDKTAAKRHTMDGARSIHVDIRGLSPEQFMSKVKQWEKDASVKTAADWKASVSMSSAEEQAVRSRFEKNKPADPTENMSPEDAKKWKVEHEENKDNFTEKEASVLDEETAFEMGPRLELETAALYLRNAGKGQQVKKNVVRCMVSLGRAMQLMHEDRAAEACERAASIMQASGMWDTKPKQASRIVPLEDAKKGDMVEIEVGTPWPNSSKKEKVTGKVVQVKKDALTVDVEKSSSNPGGHSNEDVTRVDVRLPKKQASVDPWKKDASFNAESLAKLLDKLADSLFDLRVDLRKAYDGVQTIHNDYMGVTGLHLTDNAHLKGIRDSIHGADVAMGEAARGSEFLSLVLKGKRKMPGT